MTISSITRSEEGREMREPNEVIRPNGGYSANEDMDPTVSRVPLYPVSLECMKVWLLFAAFGVLPIYAAYVQVGDFRTIYYPLILLLAPILSTYIRRKIHSLILYLILHVAMGSFALAAPDAVSKAIAIVFLLLLTVYGIVRQVSKEPERELTFFSLVSLVASMLVVYIFASAMGKMEYETPLMIQGFIYTIVYLYYDHQVAITDALKKMDKQGTMSTRNAVAFNRNVFGAYLLMVIMLLVGAYAAGLGRFLSSMGRNLMRLIRAIVGALSKGQTSEITMEDPIGELLEESQMEDMPLPQAETSMFWVILQHVLEVAFVLFIVFGIVLLLIRLFKSFNQAKVYHAPDYEEYTSRITKVKPDKQQRVRWNPFDRSPENKIRRAYYRLVRRKIDKDVYRSDTPLEVSEKLPEVKEILSSYEQVRYGNGIKEE